jgi:hypothetical protein
MAARVDHTKLHEVLDENLRLGEELELTQQRLQSARQTHAQELGRAQAQWHQLKANEPDLPTRQALADENAHLLAHNRLLRELMAEAVCRAQLTPEQHRAVVAGLRHQWHADHGSGHPC